MAAATVTTKPKQPLASDDVVLTLTAGETYISKLSKPIIVQCTPLENIGTATPMYATISGRTITFDCASGKPTDKLYAVSVKGNL